MFRQAAMLLHMRLLLMVAYVDAPFVFGPVTVAKRISSFVRQAVRTLPFSFGTLPKSVGTRPAECYWLGDTRL
jgi:hypothetical protein